MAVSNLVGLFGGVAFTSIGLFIAPTFVLGCNSFDIFPIPPLVPSSQLVENPFCFHCNECTLESPGMVWLLGYYAAVFVVSGAFASRIGETTSPSRGALAVGITTGGALLYLALFNHSNDASSTVLVGVGALVGAMALAYVGGYFAKYDG
jgi:hypothetical protein